MAYVLFIIGAMLIVSGAKDTYKAFGTQIYNDFAGSGSSGFIYWIVAIGIIGAVGYYQPWRKGSRLFLALIIITYIVRNGGVFQQLQQALQQGPQQPTSNAVPLPDSIPLHLSGLGGSPIPIKLESSQGGASLPGLGGGGGGATSMLGAAAGLG